MKLNRRRILRAAGVSLTLPCFDAFASAHQTRAPRRRMVCICTPLGLHPDNFFPKEAGKDYALTPYLEVIKDYRDDFTVISGLSHPGISPGFAHQATASFLTGVPGAGRPGFRNGISLDQFAAEHIGTQTRFPSLTLSGHGLGISWTRSGAQVPADDSPSRVFAKMFLAGRADEVQAQVRRLEDNRSILDDVRQQAKSLRSDLGSDDREKLDEYMSSVRKLEQRLVTDEAWSKNTQAKGGCRAAPRHPQQSRPHRPNATAIRPHTSGTADRFDSADHHHADRIHQRSTHRWCEPGPSRPFAPRQRSWQAGTIEDCGNGDDEDCA